MAKFKIGEIVIALGNHGRSTTECEIMALPDTTGRYKIKVEGCRSNKHIHGWWKQPECFLRKKKPPEEEKSGSWEEVQKLTNWNPTQEKVHDRS